MKRKIDKVIEEVASKLMAEYMETFEYEQW